MKNKPITLKPGDSIPFDASTPEYGNAEFHFCLEYQRGVIRRIWVTACQQPRYFDPTKRFAASTQHNWVTEVKARNFAVGSWTHKGISEPRVWRHEMCEEKHAICVEAYVPREANVLLYVGSAENPRFMFDRTESAPSTAPSVGAQRESYVEHT